MAKQIRKRESEGERDSTPGRSLSHVPIKRGERRVRDYSYKSVEVVAGSGSLLQRGLVIDWALEEENVRLGLVDLVMLPS